MYEVIYSSGKKKIRLSVGEIIKKECYYYTIYYCVVRNNINNISKQIADNHQIFKMHFKEMKILKTSDII